MSEKQKRLDEIRELAKSRRESELKKAHNPWEEKASEQIVIPGNQPGRYPGAKK
jgi:hypothetical protein